MTATKWGDKKVPVADLLADRVDGAPSTIVTLGNLLFLDADWKSDGDADLRCIPVNADGTVDTDDVGSVDFDLIDPMVADACRRSADLLRAVGRVKFWGRS